jgi:iron-sulfur cluster assembly protein
MKPVLTLTKAATNRIKDLVQDDGGLRIGLKKGGCAGMEYQMDIAKAPEQNDMLIEQDGVRVYLAASAQMFLIGTEVDYENGLLDSGFKFRNPNVAESCGCGESVSFSIEELKSEIPML